MDPDATLKLIMEHIADKAWEDCFYSCLDLQNWLNKDGFAPMEMEKEQVLGFLAVVKKFAKASSIAF